MKQYKATPDLFVACYHGTTLIGVCWGFRRGTEAILSHIAVDARHGKKGIGA